MVKGDGWVVTGCIQIRRTPIYNVAYDENVSSILGSSMNKNLIFHNWYQTRDYPIHIIFS